MREICRAKTLHLVRPRPCNYKPLACPALGQTSSSAQEFPPGARNRRGALEDVRVLKLDMAKGVRRGCWLHQPKVGPPPPEVWMVKRARHIVLFDQWRKEPHQGQRSQFQCLIKVIRDRASRYTMFSVMVPLSMNNLSINSAFQASKPFPQQQPHCPCP